MRRIAHLVSAVFFVASFFGVNAAPASAQCCGLSACYHVCTTNGCQSDNSFSNGCMNHQAGGLCYAVTCTEPEIQARIAAATTGPWRMEWLQLCAARAKSTSPYSQPKTALLRGVAVLGAAHAQLSGRGAALVYIAFGKQALFQQARIVNLGTKKIASYRLGWVYTFLTERPEVFLGDWVDAAAGISPETFSLVPERAGKQASDQVVKARGANSIVFFVAALKYADGTSWRENTTVIEREADSNKPILDRAARARAGAASKSGLE